ncbi:TRAP transporter substrate-binding protein [Halodesulfovibrio marinisediminis]|uniref:Tripartite ATP-independent transporter solute receptor, DctP family n=1 Tax=Halodesulfovibrio marinisediminis DSM 17456 TaxID=1121457 RepID=A0A1N6HI21_9BACT|nr:TRAP transporter substrate-binding protein DctP [Halodesulfovibrio marinisediminis]SIO19402.1 tripartite ATP-independent transporter solute receptor, DctP family [Halodesulfovibrio marinisediminis DSM 17456]
MTLNELSWRSIRRSILVGFLILTIPTAVLAGTNIKMSYNGPASAEDNAVHVFATSFKKLVEKETNSSITIELFPNSQLGNEQQRMEQVMTDPMINVASFGGMETVFPEIFATNVPFLFENYQAAHIFFDSSPVMAKMREEFKERTGVQLLEVIEEGGFIAFTCNKPIKSPKDFKGLKFRAMDASQVAMYEAFGAAGTPIPWTEVYLALKTGVVDGQMNPPTYIIIGSLFEVQNHLTLANVQYSDQFLLVNNAMMNDLSEKEQSAIRTAAKKANELTRTFVESQVENRIKFLQEKGMKVYTPTPEEMASFKELSTPSYIAWLSQHIEKKWIEQAITDAQKANNEVH